MSRAHGTLGFPLAVVVMCLNGAPMFEMNAIPILTARQARMIALSLHRAPIPEEEPIPGEQPEPEEDPVPHPDPVVREPVQAPPIELDAQCR